MEEKEVKIQAMNKKQLANLYNVGEKTMKKWLEPFQNQIGEYRGRAYTPVQIKIIFELIGSP